MNLPVLPTEPADGWGKVPSVDIPSKYNFGHLYHYLIETRPKLSIPEEHIIATSKDSDSGIGDSVSDSELDNDMRGEDPFENNKPLVFAKKPLRKGYKLVRGRFILKIEDGKVGSHYLVQATIRPSMRSKTTYRTKVVMSCSSGSLLKGMCRGRSLGRCVHVSGLLLFLIVHTKLNGFKGKLASPNIVGLLVDSTVKSGPYVCRGTDRKKRVAQ